MRFNICQHIDFILNAEMSHIASGSTLNKFVSSSTFNLVHRREFALPQIVERLTRSRLKVGRVLAHSGGRREAAFAHARMVAQTALIHVRMRKSVCNGYSLVLGHTKKHNTRLARVKHKHQFKSGSCRSYRVKNQHLTQQMHRFVRRVRAQRVKG